jgi:Tfp pilus assembly protein PilF
MKKNKSILSNERLFNNIRSLIFSNNHAESEKLLNNYLKDNKFDGHAWSLRSLQLLTLGNGTLAFDAANIAIKISPNIIEAYTFRGSALMMLFRYEEALLDYDEVVNVEPSSNAYYNKGNALYKLGKFNDSILSLEMALSNSPANTNAITLLGLVNQALGHPNEALKYFNNALSIDSNAADAHYNRGLLYLKYENFKNGWEDYAWRLKWNVTIRVGQSNSINKIFPEWQGQQCSKPILVTPEQGLGDQIFYAGLLTDLQAHIPGSTVCIDQRLITLLSRSFPNLFFLSPDQFNLINPANYNYSYQLHLGSLGKFFRNEFSDFVNIKSSYLVAESNQISFFREKIDSTSKKKLVCGLSWRSKNQEFGISKSISLNELLPILSHPNIQFVDLQYDDTSSERSLLESNHKINIKKYQDLDNFNDIDDLAALISACDLVVTVSNTTAHLASALGKTTLVLLPNSHTLFWYWHLDRDTSPWYPNSTLLRQVTPGDWTNVVELASKAIDAFSVQFLS